MGTWLEELAIVVEGRSGRALGGLGEMMRGGDGE